MRYGLSDQTIHQINSIFAKHPTVKQAVLYGSRAKGNYKPGSDIDLTLFGEDLSQQEADQILEELDAIDLPHTIDLSVFKNIVHTKLRDHISRVGVVFYQRKNETHLKRSNEDKALGRCECLEKNKKDSIKKRWETKVISEVADVFDGPHATPKTVEAGPIFLGIGALTDGVINLRETRHVTEDDFKTWTRRVRPQSGDVVFSYETRIGQAAIIPDNFDCCLGRRMGLVRFKTNEVIPKFFLYQYIAPAYRSFLNSKTIRGATVDRISIKEFPYFPITIPSIEEQRFIVTILDDAFERIDAAIANSEKNLANARELFESYLDKCFNQTMSGWKHLTLKEISKDFGRGKSKHRPRNDPALYDGDYPFVQTGDVRGADHYIKSYSKTYNATGLAQSKLWPKGTVCITIAANIAETGILSFDSCFPDSVIGVVVNKNIAINEYVEYALQFMRSKLKKEGKGSAQDNINLGTFENRGFPFAPLEQQKKIVFEINRVREAARDFEKNCQQKIIKMGKIKQSLLEKAFSGELTSDFNPDTLEH
jgi:type I restriction enzyme S subunit